MSSPEATVALATGAPAAGIASCAVRVGALGAGLLTRGRRWGRLAGAAWPHAERVHER